MDKAPPKVFLVITKSNWGGAQAYVFDLAIALKAQGSDVTVVAGGEGLLLERLKSEGVRVISHPGITRDVAMIGERHLSFTPKIVFDSIKKEFDVLKDLITLFKLERPDVVHLNSSKIGGLGALAARLSGIRTIVFTAHGWPHKEPRAFPVKAAIWLLSWITLALSTKVIAVSENDVRLTPAFFSRKKVTLVRNGASPFPLKSRADARAELSLPSLAKVILSIAELHMNKGIDTAIHAFAELSSAHPDWLYAVIGEGEEREHLETCIRHYKLEGRVLLLGFKADARRYLSAADLFLLPSRKEGLPLTLLEAGLASLPSVATRVGGMPEVIRHKDTGLLAPSENPHALARTLRIMIEHPEDARRYGDALKKRVEEKFSKERMLEETFALY
jgi:glycosyltransferase involved in cell wall biosynthesis